MSMQDTLADMFTRIRNSAAILKKQVSFPHTKLKESVLLVLRDQGYITDFATEKTGSGPHANLVVTLKYYQGVSVINNISRASRSSLRQYRKSENMPEVKDGLGIAIVTTSKGVMTSREAKKQNVGGELICYVD